VVLVPPVRPINVEELLRLAPVRPDAGVPITLLVLLFRLLKNVELPGVSYPKLFAPELNCPAPIKYAVDAAKLVA
jgi:hypothetical protein